MCVLLWGMWGYEKKDEITISIQQDLDEALRLAKIENRKSLKINVIVPEASEGDEEVKQARPTPREANYDLPDGTYKTW